MGTIHLVPPPEKEEPPALHERAMDNLRYIRETMERASSFTGISGWGEVAIGLSALGAAALAARQTVFNLWLAIWMGEALVSLLIAGWSIDRKARRAKTPLLNGAGRKMVFSLFMGLCFMALGAATLFVSPVFADWFMGAGFGGLHIIFGVVIARRYGG
jgi:hypothetical protein